MPMSADENADLKAKLAAARQKPLNFGLSLSNKPEESAMLIHRTLKPEKLQKDAKKMAGSPKVACGTVECKGKLVMLTCFGDPPSTAAKRLKVFLKAATGESMKIQIMDVDGNVVESEDDGEQKEGLAPQSTPGTEQSQEPGSDGDLAARLDTALQKLAPKIKEALTQNPRAKDAVQKLILAIKSAGTEGDAAAAKKRLGQLNDVLNKVIGSGSGDGVAKISLVKLGKARLEWPDTHSRAFGDLNRLKKQIEADYADMPEAAEVVAKAIKRLDDSFSTFNAKLHDQLDEVLNADEEGRKAQVATARQMIDRFSKHLAGDPIISALDGNDILPDVAIAAPIQAKLQEISVALGS